MNIKEEFRLALRELVYPVCVVSTYNDETKREYNLNNCVMASDAFFPFTDSIKIAKRVGIKSIIQPGGSINDQKVIDAVNEANISMVFTRNRCFSH